VQNRRLNERLRTLQAEERAELARNLHDEIGPLLFAVDVAAAAVARLAEIRRTAEIPAQVWSIHDAVARMQRHVRVILGRLRPITAIGLKAALDRLAAFWRSRCPGVDLIVAVAVQEDRIGEDLRETIYRIVQEGVSNAIRHGRSSRVEIRVGHEDDEEIRVTVRDNGTGMAPESVMERSPAGLGLTGMRERVMAMAGSLSIGQGLDGRGLELLVRLPCVGQHSQPLGVAE
jgi:two-component system sensor histidine kinase UhpB